MQLNASAFLYREPDKGRSLHSDWGVFGWLRGMPAIPLQPITASWDRRKGWSYVTGFM